MKRLKVLIINGSPNENGNTSIALGEMVKVFDKNDIDTEVINVGKEVIRGCIACGSCGKTGKCVFNDKVNEISEKFKEADGLVVGTPVYYASANATVVALMDRMFYSSHFDMRMKVGATVCAARRGGLTSTFDEMNKYFTISGMPVASGQYWNGIHGNGGASDAYEDEEGMQMMRTLASNMIFLMKSIALGKEAFGLPEQETHAWTNFVR
ncbi:MAG: flavodoxin family protein [Clostridia bacterium]|nr:flavodoxin family protein [Clostridia bacterium]